MLGERWGTVVKSNYTNGYSGLEWSTANTAITDEEWFVPSSPLSPLGVGATLPHSQGPGCILGSM